MQDLSPRESRRHRDSSSGSGLSEVTPDIARMRTLMVNLFFVGNPNGWVLLDTGLPLHAARIVTAAEQWFGPNARPAAIILTHGHFDHVGNVRELAQHWDVPVYAHALEMPYLTGRSDYPPPDSTVGGGMFARMSKLYPKSGIDLGQRIWTLPEDGSVPGMPGWRWVHTPGHTAGHVSFFRDADRVVLAGDAFITQKQESFWGVVTQMRHMEGPPAYFTSDWDAARRKCAKAGRTQPTPGGHRARPAHGRRGVGDRLTKPRPEFRRRRPAKIRPIRNQTGAV